ncbi:hypothetical protein ACQP3F_32425, partial [Escherichia coli]
QYSEDLVLRENQQDQLLSKLTKWQRVNMQINKIRIELWNITTDRGNPENHQVILRKHVFLKI